MSTKYYLHGGKISVPCEENDEFVRLVTSQLGNNSSVLLCYFSRPEDTWESSLTEDSEMFSKFRNNLKFVLASKNNFVEQVKDSQVIYLAGGDSFDLINQLQNYPNLVDLFKEKVVVGVSAGVCALSKYFYSNDKQCVGEGIGMINYKVICHYTPDKINKYNELNRYEEQITVLALAEQKYVIINEN